VATTALTDPLVGRLLDGRYRIVARIARGGMATVYEAVDTRLDRTVALKSMHAHLVEDEDFVARFIREARSAARLGHPNVVAVFDQGTAGDPWSPHRVVYLVMELVRGRTLRQVLRERGPLSPADALQVIEPVLAALRAAHEARIVHRDVKPENVLLADDGRVKVADFGLARALSADSQHTRTSGLLLGTVSYLAPEQVLGRPCDARADVYAAGIVLFEMLTGSKPYEADTPIQVAYRHVHERVPAPSTRRGGIPPAVDQLVLRATDPDPDGRFVDGRDFLAAVRSVSADLVTGHLEPPRPAPTGATAAPRPVVRRALTEDSLGGDVRRDAADDSPTDDRGQGDGAATDRSAAETTVVPLVTERPALQLPTPQRPSLQGSPIQRPAAQRPAAQRPALRQPVPRASGAQRLSAATRSGRRPLTLAEQRARHAALSRRRRRRGVLALVLVVLVAAAVGVTAWWFGDGRFTTVPQLTGASETSAQARLAAADLQMQVGSSRFDTAVPAGYVLDSAQSPNQRVERGATVTVVVSRGTERVRVPSLVGTTDQAARTAVTALGLNVGTVTAVDSEDQPAGQVAASTPAAGAAAPVGARVDLTVSRGPAPVQAPAVVGKALGVARSAAGAVQLPVTVVTKPSATVPAGVVIAQSPGDGPVPGRTPLTLTVSAGRPVVAVPTGLDGLRAAAAAARLTGLGFTVTIRRAPQWVGLDQVWALSSPAGSRLPYGSPVVLTVV